MAKYKFERAYTYLNTQIPKGSVVEGEIKQGTFMNKPEDTLFFDINGTNSCSITRIQ